MTTSQNQHYMCLSLVNLNLQGCKDQNYICLSLVKWNLQGCDGQIYRPDWQKLSSLLNVIGCKARDVPCDWEVIEMVP